MKPRYRIIRISLFFIGATAFSNIFRFQLFDLDRIYENLPLWSLVITGPLQSVAIFISAFIAYIYLKRQSITLHSLFGKSMKWSLAMAAVPLLVLSFVGLENTEEIPSNLLGLFSGISFLLYCIFEEYGWRGYLEDELRPLSEFYKIILIALMWYAWHLSFLSDHSIFNNLKFFGILLIGSWGISQVIKSTHSIISAACFHMIYNILMMQSNGKIEFDLNKKLFVIGACVISWIIILKLWERQSDANEITVTK